jgi:hypothetical protein
VHLKHAVQRIMAAVEVDDDSLGYLMLELSRFEHVRDFVSRLKDHIGFQPIDLFISE